jgi:hypothetical protein
MSPINLGVKKAYLINKKKLPVKNLPGLNKRANEPSINNGHFLSHSEKTQHNMPTRRI